MVASEEMRRRKEEYPILESPLARIFEPADADRIDRVVFEEWHPRRQIMLLHLSYLTMLAEQD